MSLRLRKTIQNGHFTAKVYADSEWQEYRVRYYKDGVYLGEEADSHDDDEDSAIDTARAELNFLNSGERNA